MNAAPPLHTREQFCVTVNAPFEVAWPLFGAHQERLWAPDWRPMFLWPTKPSDQEGMVFKVVTGDKAAVWVNTDFDPATKRIRYVYVIPELVVTVITLTFLPDDLATRVEVLYERTALAPAAREIVAGMAARDRLAGKEWSEQINRYLSLSQ